MGESEQNHVRVATTTQRDEAEAVEELATQLRAPWDSSVLVFCSSRYDLERLANALRHRLGPDVFGCTTAGQIGPRGFQRGGIVALALAKKDFTLHPYFIESLEFCQSRAAEIAEPLIAVERALPAEERSFGILLVDGLSMMEERLCSALYHAVGATPIIGGSAGDDLRFEQTYVYFDGKFHANAAAFLYVATPLPFALLQIHHLRPTKSRVVITEATPELRIVREINGEPAAKAYAEIVGVPVGALNPNIFSRHPLMLKLEGTHYIRSVQRVEPDGSLKLYCAIEKGLVLSIGEPRNTMSVLEESFSKLQSYGVEPEVILGFDCILRRLDFEQQRLDAAVGRFLAAQKVVGFSTYGEQYNSIHINQTFTGVALGGPHES